MLALSGSGDRLAAVTKSDTTDQGPVAALYIGGAGDVVIKTASMAAGVTLASVPAGTILPIRARYVMAATTATNIVAIF